MTGARALIGVSWTVSNASSSMILSATKPGPAAAMIAPTDDAGARPGTCRTAARHMANDTARDLVPLSQVRYSGATPRLPPNLPEPP